MEPHPVMGRVKNCTVECHPLDPESYGGRCEGHDVSRKLFLEMIASSSDMEEDLTQLKNLNIQDMVERVEKITRSLDTQFKSISYGEYLGEKR